MLAVADRDNEDAQLYTQIQALIAQQAEVREQQRADACRLELQLHAPIGALAPV